MRKSFWRRRAAPQLPPLVTDPSVLHTPHRDLDPGDPVLPPVSTLNRVDALDEVAARALQAIEEQRFPPNDVPND